MKISIVIPTYNGGDRLPALCNKIIQSLSPHVAAKDFEIIIVDDGSQNRSENLIGGPGGKGVNIKGVFLKRNYGQQLATLAGLRVSLGDFVFTIDDDLAHNPQDFSGMLDLSEKEDMDVVFAVSGNSSRRMFRKGGSVIRDLIFSILFRKPAGISVSSFRLLRRSLVVRILADISEYRYLSVEILKHAEKMGNMQVSFKRVSGSSSRYGFIKLAILALSLIRCSPIVPAKLRKSITASTMEYEVI